MTPAKVFSCGLIEILRTLFLQNTSGLETFKENTYKEMSCDFIKVGLYQEHFQKNSPSHTWLIIFIRFITLKNNWMNPCVKTEEKCNESVNNEFKIMRKRFITSNNESEQIIKQAHRIHVCLIIFLIHYFDIINMLKSDKIHYILIQ